VRKIPDRALEGLDLSSWRVAFNGAEPVSADTIERFVARFAPFGFRREAMMPVYGLAESSVALCFPPVGRAPRVDAVARAPLESAGSARPAGHHEPALRTAGHVILAACQPRRFTVADSRALKTLRTLGLMHQARQDSGSRTGCASARKNWDWPAWSWKTSTSGRPRRSG